MKNDIFARCECFYVFAAIFDVYLVFSFILGLCGNKFVEGEHGHFIPRFFLCHFLHVWSYLIGLGLE